MAVTLRQVEKFVNENLLEGERERVMEKARAVAEPNGIIVVGQIKSFLKLRAVEFVKKTMEDPDYIQLGIEQVQKGFARL